jgi:multidrug efflux pump subunit AcrB
MALIFVAGAFSFTRINTQFFPEFGIDVITVLVAWPGASAEDADTNIIQALEPEVRFIDGVSKVFASSFEGRAVISLEFEPGTDLQRALSDVENGVAQVTTLPEGSERPVINRIVRYDTISRLVISGPYPETSMKAIAKRVRDDLLARGIDKVSIFGTRDEEIWVEIRPETLRRLDLTLADVARRIDESSRDVPSGGTSGRAERQIRSLGLATTARGVADIEVRALETGQKIYLRDIANVSEAFEEGGKTGRRKGQAAVELFVQRAANADSLKLADIVDEYLSEMVPELPPNLVVEKYDVQSDLTRSRIDLLLRNGAGGLVLVLVILFIFLSARISFWVAMGIPISLFATCVVMILTGQTINMISLFGLIMAIGIIVDDAIVVGEHSEARHRAGMRPLEAAESGALRMAAPVLSSSLTTVAAFLPLLLISDIIGQIIQAIPFVVVSIILASLVECFLILPGHLRGAMGGRGERKSRPRAWFDRRFDRFRDRSFKRFVALCMRWRYATTAFAVATLIISIGVIKGGFVGFVFFPSPEADRVFANVKFAAGTPKFEVVRMLDEMERALLETEGQEVAEKGGLVQMSMHKVGTSSGRFSLDSIGGDHLGSIIVELVPSDKRNVTAAAFIEKWRANINATAGVDALTIQAQQGGPPGREIDIRLSGADLPVLKRAAGEVRALLLSFPGVSDIDDDLPFGKREAILELTPRGKALGFTTQSVGRQVRNAFEGAIATRFPRGDEEVTVRVQYPRGAVDLAALDSLYLRGPSGAEVPLASVVTLREKSGFARIRRVDGVRQVAITADVDKSRASNEVVLAEMTKKGLPEIAAKYGVEYDFRGRAEEQKRTFKDMGMGALIGLVCIYIILAWVFSSYTRPIVVMSVIPLGFVGATLGHLLLGFDLTILSMVALIGLSGIVVNNSIILVSIIDERIARGEEIFAAIVDGVGDRLRPVILTSATTIGGLTPLMFETDLQAQFLIPMALTIVFGLLVSTLMVLIVVPALLGIQADFGSMFRRSDTSSDVQPAE